MTTGLECIAMRLTGLPDVASSIAAQSLYHALAAAVEHEPAMTETDARLLVYFIAGFTRGMAEAPANWTDGECVSSVRFDASYQDSEHPSRVLASLKADLLKMDATLEESFHVEHLCCYLRDIAECARLLITGLEKE